MSLPLIGVTTSELRLGGDVRHERHGEPPRVEMALGMSYLRAVERAGGLPVVLPPLDLERIAPLLDRLGGVLLSGGPDLDPGTYGRPAHPELGATSPRTRCASPPAATWRASSERAASPSTRSITRASPASDAACTRSRGRRTA